MKGAIFCHTDIIENYDHIAPLSYILNVPIHVCDDPVMTRLCEKYYPQVEFRELTLNESTPRNLVANNDFMIFPSHVQREEKYLIAEKERQEKKCALMFCPHGFSDKTYYWLEYSEKDFIFVYGQNMLDLFEKIRIFLDKEKCIRVGNYRYEFYKQHRNHQINLVKSELFDKLDLKRKNLLYAPTWLDDGNASTFFEGIHLIIKSLPEEYNLIIKMHPRILVCHSDRYYEVLASYAQRENVVFIDEFPMIYPILDLCDYYLGDMSSIAYDFLSFNKPMFFIDKPRNGEFLDRQKYLFRCGTRIGLEELDRLYEIISGAVPQDEGRYSQVRKEVYEYTFGKPLLNSEIKDEFEKKVLQFLTQ